MASRLPFGPPARNGKPIRASLLCRVWRLRVLNRLQAIGRGARGQTRGSGARDEPRGTARPVSPADSVLLLVPFGGGMAFLLFAVESEAAAAAFVQKEYPQLAEKSITF